MICAPAFAEVNSYTDQNGNPHFTDETSPSPAARWPGAASHQAVEKETDSNQVGDQIAPEQPTEDNSEDKGNTGNQGDISKNLEDKADTEDQGQSETENQKINEDQTQTDDQTATGATGTQPETTPKGSPSWTKEARQKQNEIDAKKKDLNVRYDSLQEEKAQLGPAPSNDATPEERREYYMKSKTLNDKIGQYQKDYTDTEKQITDFNAKYDPNKAKGEDNTKKGE